MGPLRLNPAPLEWGADSDKFWEGTPPRDLPWPQRLGVIWKRALRRRAGCRTYTSTILAARLSALFELGLTTLEVICGHRDPRMLFDMPTPCASGWCRSSTGGLTDEKTGC
jgi:hypothetical protein